MKATFLFLVTIGLAGVALENSYAAPFGLAGQQGAGAASESSAKPNLHDGSPAAPSEQTKNQKKGTSSAGQRSRPHVSDKNHARNLAGPSDSKHPTPVRKGVRRSTSENPANLRSPAAGKSGSPAATKDFSRSTGQKPGATSRQPSISRDAEPPLKDVRHRGQNPALIGGPSNSRTRNSSAINGTTMNRKPG